MLEFMRGSAQAVNHEIEIRISDNVNILRLRNACGAYFGGKQSHCGI